MMHKYFVYWGFRQHLQQKHFSTFPGGGGQVPMPASAHVDNCIDLGLVVMVRVMNRVIQYSSDVILLLNILRV